MKTKMTRIIMLIVLTGASGCSLHTFNRIGVALTAAAVTIDIQQTAAEANGGWSGGSVHENGIPMYMFGKHPTSNQLEAYNIISVVGLLAMYWVLPPKIKPSLWIPVITLEVDMITMNAVIQRESSATIKLRP